MKKPFIIFIAVLTLLSFGTVTSAHAVVDLIALTVVLSTGVAGAIAASEIFKGSDKAEKDADQAKQSAPVQEVKDNARVLPDNTVLSPG